MIGKEEYKLAMMLGVVLVAAPAPAQSTNVTVVPDADSFVRSAAATNNYGAGGALSVCGTAATNGIGLPTGAADTLIRFATSNAVTTFNGALGGTDWIVTGIRLALTETAGPDNSIFGRGIGAFEIRWIATDDWTEGTGKPTPPTTDGVAWQNLPQILNSNLDVSLGIFTNSGANTQLSFTLGLSNRLVEDIRSGGEVGFYLTAQSPGIGFTFNSRNFGNTNAQPALVITAKANPRPWIDAIERQGTNVAIRFSTTSNWTYTLQCTDALGPYGSMGWSNALNVPAQTVGSNVAFVEPATSRQRFYRLSVTP